MKLTFKIFVSFISISLFLPAFVFAVTPSLPHQFFGTVNFTNGIVNDGLMVEAKISGIVAGSSVTANGKYGYNPNLLFVIDNNEAPVGKTVEFYVNGIKANETAIFANGDSSQLNLTIPVTSTASTGGGSGGGSGSDIGGGGGIIIPPIIASPLSAAAQKVDANKDNKINVLDFNILMVNWGSASANNLADFNGDNKVDVFDFNLLMINWTL